VIFLTRRRTVQLHDVVTTLPDRWRVGVHGTLPFMADDVEALYRAVIKAWNDQDGDAMAQPFAADGTVIGFDGSVHSGRETIARQMNEIFGHHPTARYVTKIESVRALAADAAVLRAIAGMVPPDEEQVKPELNTHHTVVAERREGTWELVLYQNTPAQLHGRPDLVEAMTTALQELVDAGH
jgi:uncharacterized protein (TIGR02246 family)